MRRYAGIVVDIYYDFFLHRHWNRFSPNLELNDFIASVHEDLEGILDQAPAVAREAIEAMMEQSWLLEYSTLEGIDRTLHRVSQRSPILISIFETSEILSGQLPGMEKHFLAFYPDLLAYMPNLRDEIRAGRKAELSA